LEIGRALATEPQLVLLDEPAAGLNIRETRDLGGVIKKIRQELKITIVLVEHDMDLVMRISDSITVLNFGEVIADGTPLEVQKNPEVIVAYLGEEEEIQRGYNAHS
jgi:branched-chain amino acid transport system ATP-binding protein